jgi:hypothetical protein
MYLGRYKIYLGRYEIYLDSYKIYLGSYKVYLGRYKIYLGSYRMYLGGFTPSALRAARMPSFFRKLEHCSCAARILRKAECPAR